MNPEQAPDNPPVAELVAVGLCYDPQSMEVPEVGFIGFEAVAREMMRTARRYGIPLVEDNRLAQELSTLEQEEVLPERLFVPVAEVFRRMKYR